MTLFVSIVGSIFILLAVFVLLSWVKTPHYRPDTEQVMRLLQWVLLEQATENDWRVFCDIPIRHDDRLEAIRLQCIDIEERHFIGPPRLLSKEGLAEIRQLLESLEGDDSRKDKT